MSDQFLAEIRIFGCNFAPVGWALCNGAILPISQFTAVFSLLGTQYGGNGTSNFALPNLQGSSPMNAGNGAGLTPRVQGETGGEQTVTLLQTQMPAHSHSAQGSSGSNQASPAANAWGSGQKLGGGKIYAPSSANNVQMNPAALSPAGGNLPHNNLMPYLTLNFCIALQGIFPPRS
ncbi:MAG TPA: tail fiber protein [Candidatus Angelobacter sp.]